MQRAIFWLKAVATLGRMWLLSRRPHIEETLPADFGDGDWILIATQHPVQPGQPVYGTPAYQAVAAGHRYWVFVGEGDYWVYAMPGTDPMRALRDFYADPDAAELVDSAVPSLPGFRTDLSRVS